MFGRMVSCVDTFQKRGRKAHFILPTFLDDFSVNEDGVITQKKGLETIDLAFEGIKLEMKTKTKEGKTRLLLDGSIHGRAKAGRMLAVMGPSGAGKVSDLCNLRAELGQMMKSGLNNCIF